MKLLPGQRVFHKDYGNGIVVSGTDNEYIKVFFSKGERLLSGTSLQVLLSPSEKIISELKPNSNNLRKMYLSYLAHSIPITDKAISLTSAKIDLLPHQIVLTHKIATSFPRRFLIADEVGLGKTIETAMILRELSSRDEMNRALMVVPAGLVNNWHRELNEVFHLNFEVFGSEGDVTDRKSNAFQKHNLLIASIDTLKKAERMKKLKEAPKWDLVVFDEGHHLTAYKSGSKVKKTENYKLAELLKDHSRDLLVLSATPHQGDHFRFWMIVQLLESTLFKNPEEMLLEKHRLNHVVIRRTKADACKPDGETLFARRWVHTEAFPMTETEKTFYQKLNDYLEDGFDLAKQQGNKGRAIGFVMAIFQKIAASSFAAVFRTLRRRLISITIQEIITYENERETQKRDASYKEAIELVLKEYDLKHDQVGIAEAERIVIDFKRKILKKIEKEDYETDSEIDFEISNQNLEDDILSLAQYTLPEEKKKIYELLNYFPEGIESKAYKLTEALQELWKQNPQEKIVIFATYLGTVEMLERIIGNSFPAQGVVVLKGGDHGAKLSAENKFKKRPGPNVMICTAAGREGINLQHARILFNFNLPWNPMDMEQRIGRIHRYGQMDTAQVYNLVLSDTIEGKIFLLLEKKLKEIAKALGKVDRNDQIAEDFNSQILGQLSEKLNYDKLYREAINDLELKRTSEELEVAMKNAKEAREVVFELFQDLESFNLDDYRKISDSKIEQDRLVDFLKRATEEDDGELERINDTKYRITYKAKPETFISTDREESLNNEELDLIGIDHPIIMNYIQKYKNLNPDEMGTILKMSSIPKDFFYSIWFIDIKGDKGEKAHYILPIAVDENQNRLSKWELHPEEILLSVMNDFSSPIPKSSLEVLHKVVEPIVQREIQHRNWLKVGQDYQMKLISWIEVVTVN